jgi:hypothetical protein
MRPLPLSGWLLAMSSAFTALAASAVTLVWDGAFPPAPGQLASAAGAEARGWSAVTLLLAVPVLVFCLSEPPRQVHRARMAAMGGLVYLAYTYLELAVSPPFTPLYLAYVLVFATAIPAIVIIGRSVDIELAPWTLGEGAPRKAIALYSLAFAIVLSAAWLRGVVSAMAAGTFGWPSGDAAVGHVVHALDLGLVVPLGVSTGLLLLKRRPGGDVLAMVTITFAVLMGAALAAMVGWRSVVDGHGLAPALPFALAWLAPVALALRLWATSRTAPPKVKLHAVPRLELKHATR